MKGGEGKIGGEDKNYQRDKKSKQKRERKRRRTEGVQLKIVKLLTNLTKTSFFATSFATNCDEQKVIMETETYSAVSEAAAVLWGGLHNNIYLRYNRANPKTKYILETRKRKTKLKGWLSGKLTVLQQAFQVQQQNLKWVHLQVYLQEQAVTYRYNIQLIYTT